MSSRLIILEGPDCSGKTTLAKFISQRYGYIYWHCDGNEAMFKAMFEYQRNVLDNIEWTLKNMTEARCRGWVLDRHWPSEYVYGRIFKRTGFDHGALQVRARELGALYIFCRRTSVMTAHKNEADPAHPYSEEDFKKVVDGYEKWFNKIRNVENYAYYDVDVEGHHMPTWCRTNLELI